MNSSDCKSIINLYFYKRLKIKQICNKEEVFIILKHGKILEMGNHNEPMIKDGYYKKLVYESAKEKTF